jgi:tetratricopeptide (TPR) repeat protein
MSDPLSTEPVHPLGPTGDADREARIEELLLTGLDHYFAGQYERAIGVWTRVVFLERHHDRARAYIERARSALAERQREAEELLHTGVAAYNAGEIDKAREILTRAVEQGSDTAHVFLDRLNRVGGTVVSGEAPTGVVPVRFKTAAGRTPSVPRRTGWIAVGAGALVVAAMMLVGGLPIGTWLSELQFAPPPVAIEGAPAEPLPVVRASEVALARARTLKAGGHLWDALRALDRIDLADPLRVEADRVRADIQRDLLALSDGGIRP